MLHTFAPFLLDHLLLQLRRLLNKHSLRYPQLLGRLDSLPDDKLVVSLDGLSHLFGSSLIPLTVVIVHHHLVTHVYSLDTCFVILVLMPVQILALVTLSL